MFNFNIDKSEYSKERADNQRNIFGNINNDQAKTHINNFWTYLDELAEQNPEEYKKFISEQMKKGFNFNENQKNYEEAQVLKVIPYLCLRFKVLCKIDYSNNSSDRLKIHSTNLNDITEVLKILFTPKFQITNTNKILDEPKVYLNVLYSNEFMGPTDEQGNPLSDSDLKNIDKWKYIPSDFRYEGKKNSMTGKRCDFYDILISEKIATIIEKNQNFKSSILAHLVQKFSIFISEKYKLYTDNVKMLPHKKYKSIKSIPENFKITNTKIVQKGKDKVPQDSSEEISSKNFYDQNKINIPNSSENYPNTKTFYNTTKEKNINKNKINQASEKNFLIEEIKPTDSLANKEKIEIHLKKTILSKTQMEIKFDFSKFENILMENIDLQISVNEIKLKLENCDLIEYKDYQPIEMKFDFKVDVDACKASYNRKSSYLKLILVRLEN
jgi:hypothetical protein